MRTTWGTILLCFFLQRKCIKACHEKYKPSKRPTTPGELEDEGNDPHRPRPSGVLSPRPPRPSGVSPRPLRPSGAIPRPPFKPFLVRLVQLLYDCIMFYSCEPNSCVMSF